MKRGFKSGDVAMVAAYNRPEPYRAYFDGKTWREYGAGMFCVDTPTDHRPLVVIDPEDREQVEQLVRMYWPHFDDRDTRNSTTKMQAALREFTDPKPPKPDEPTGLGAVVEDGECVRYVRHHDNHHSERPWQESNGSIWNWSAIDAVKVLSEGVTS